MAIDTICQTCGKQLRVADEHAGKTARCPGCQTIYSVPHTGVAAQPGLIGQPMAWQTPPAVAAGQPDKWHLKSADGLTYGPVAKADLDQWMQQGRITPQSQIMSEADGRWVWAGEYYPQLGSFAADPGAPVNPYAPPGGAGYQTGYAWAPSGYREQHRGPVILALALVGAFFCGIACLVAIVMAIIDLQKMASGTMDPSGKGLTIAGLVIGSLPLVVWLVVIASMVIHNL
jgi:hypothetical protein